MSQNRLDNGAVLPHGIMTENPNAMMEGFNKSYRNFPLRIGVVVETYVISNEQNVSKLTTEYDVIVIEQNEDRGATTQRYRNCMSSEGLGSIADFFETTKRKMKKKSTKGDSVNTKGQNGAVVLVLCLDAMSDKGIIISFLTHPDRKTTLKTEDPRLEGEYNGVNIKVETDGSTMLTFRGATDNDGKIIDKSQGDTVIKIEKDGSYQVNHKTITQRFAKDGSASLSADGNISNTSKKNFNATATENINLKATKDLSTDSAALVMKASGAANLSMQKLSIASESEITMKGSQLKIEAEAMAKIKSAAITLDGQVALGGEGGQPVLLLGSVFIGVGNLGAPVVSQAIAGFAIKVTGQ